MVHVQNEEEAEHAPHALSLITFHTEHVYEILDQP